jgi:hypothetical protein
MDCFVALLLAMTAGKQQALSPVGALWMSGDVALTEGAPLLRVIQGCGA